MQALRLFAVRTLKALATSSNCFNSTPPLPLAPSSAPAPSSAAASPPEEEAPATSSTPYASLRLHTVVEGLLKVLYEAGCDEDAHARGERTPACVGIRQHTTACGLDALAHAHTAVRCAMLDFLGQLAFNPSTARAFMAEARVLALLRALAHPHQVLTLLALLVNKLVKKTV